MAFPCYVQLETVNNMLKSNDFLKKYKLKQLKQSLRDLDNGQFLVIHGMPGSGKSVLAAEAVRDPEITLNFFPNGVFWFRVGMLKEREKLFSRMKILCEKLEAKTTPSSIEHAQEILRNLFLSDRFDRSLVILDDVWDSEIVKTFNVSGRVLLTTQDLTVAEV